MPVTAVKTGNRIVISGGVVADDGDFDVWGSLGWTIGTDKVHVDYYCWYGADIVADDVCELETADGAPLGAPMVCTTAKMTMCHPPIGETIDRLYVDQLSHGSIVIFIKPVGVKR